MPLDPTLQARLDAIRKTYLAGLPGKLAQVRAQLDAGAERPEVERMRRAAGISHQIHGTAGTMGLTDLSQAAAALEEALEADTTADPQARHRVIRARLEAFERAVAEALSGG